MDKRTELAKIKPILTPEPLQGGIPVTVRNDYLFKKIFGREDSKKAARKLIHLVTALPLKLMEGLNYLNPSLEKDHICARQGILDIILKLEDGTRINIEMQNHWQSFYIKRAVYYLCQIYSGQLKSGKQYNKLRPAIGIHLINMPIPYANGLHMIYTMHRQGDQH